MMVGRVRFAGVPWGWDGSSEPLTELMRTEGLTYPEAVEQFYQESNE
jgi:hypothetical protein